MSDPHTTRRTVLKTIGAGIGGVAAGSGVASANAGPETLFTYDPGRGELPENVSIDRRGTKHVTLLPRGEIREITPDNRTQSTLATFDIGDGFGVGGHEVRPNGTLSVCLITFNAGAADTHGVWRVGPDGDTSLFAALPPTTFPNDVLLDGESLLVTNTSEGAVLRVGNGDWTEWVSDELLAGTGALGLGLPVGANGIAEGSDGTVYVANTEKGHIVEVPVRPDGSAGTPEIFAADPRLFAVDGLAIDTRDTVYAAVIGQNTVLRVTQDGDVETLATASDGLDNPSDVTFGTARGEQREVFVTNSALFSRDDPSLVKLDVGVPGRPIRP